MSISTLFHVGQDLFLNFFPSSSGFVTPTKDNLSKWGAKDASKGAKDASKGAKDASGDGTTRGSELICQLNCVTCVNERCFLRNDWHKGHICFYLILMLDRKVAFTRIRIGLCGQIALHF